MLFKIGSVLMPECFGVFQDKSGYKVGGPPERSRREGLLPDPGSRTGRFLEIWVGWLLRWLGGVGCTKELMCLIKSV